MGPNRKAYDEALHRVMQAKINYHDGVSRFNKGLISMKTLVRLTNLYKSAADDYHAAQDRFIENPD